MKMTLQQAERIDDYGQRNVLASAGDTVVLPPGQFGTWALTVTAEALACDCGKGVLCPLNLQRRIKSEPFPKPDAS